MREQQTPASNAGRRRPLARPPGSSAGIGLSGSARRSAGRLGSAWPRRDRDEQRPGVVGTTRRLEQRYPPILRPLRRRPSLARPPRRGGRAWGLAAGARLVGLRPTVDGFQILSLVGTRTPASRPTFGCASESNRCPTSLCSSLDQWSERTCQASPAEPVIARRGTHRCAASPDGEAEQSDAGHAVSTCGCSTRSSGHGPSSGARGPRSPRADGVFGRGSCASSCVSRGVGEVVTNAFRMPAPTRPAHRDKSSFRGSERGYGFAGSRRPSISLI